MTVAGVVFLINEFYGFELSKTPPTVLIAAHTGFTGDLCLLRRKKHN